MRAAIYASKGIGDGLIFLSLVKNLEAQGYSVDFYHDSLLQLKDFFPSISILPFPKTAYQLQDYDLTILNPDEREIFSLLKQGAKPIFSLYPTTCKSKKFAGSFRFNADKNMVENLEIFCKTELNLSVFEKGLDFVMPQKRRDERKIIIHPTSSSTSRMWPKTSFSQLASNLTDKGWKVLFALASFENEEREFFLQKGFEAPLFSSLKELCLELITAGGFIGNDSGLGHLASALGVPTLTIFSNCRKARLWRPAWSPSKEVSAFRWIPNPKILRLRERYWKQLISVKRVEKAFLRFFI